MKPLRIPRAASAAGMPENRRRTLRYGAYSAALTAAVLAVVILLNLVAGALPAQYTRADISTGQMFTLTQTTRALLDSMDRDVTAYYLGITGSEDTNITQLLDRYAGASAHFTWQQRDPNLYPNFAQQYGAAGASTGSVILTCGENSQLADYSTMYEMDYSSYYTTGSYTYSFAAESRITTALAAVLRTGRIPLYAVTGHGEKALSDDFVQTLQNAGVSVQTLNLVNAGSIPADAGAVLVNAPQVDYTAQDAAMLQSYLEGGGHLLLVTDLTVDTPNLDAVPAACGLTRQPGVLVEQDMNGYLYGYPQVYLLPTVTRSEVTAGMTEGMYTLAPVAQGIVCDDSLDYNYYPLLSTTAASYAKVDYLTAETLEQAETDPDGPFDLAVAVDGGGTNARLVWLNCANLLDTQVDSFVYGGNAQWLGSTVNWLCGQENAAVIDAKSMSGTQLDVPAAAAVALGLLFVIALPLALLAGGGIYCLLRRRR